MAPQPTERYSATRRPRPLRRAVSVYRELYDTFGRTSNTMPRLRELRVKGVRS